MKILSTYPFRTFISYFSDLHLAGSSHISAAKRRVGCNPGDPKLCHKGEGRRRKYRHGSGVRAHSVDQLHRGGARL